MQVKFMYSETSTKFYEISTVDLTGTTQDKSRVEISQNFVAFSEYMNFMYFVLKKPKTFRSQRSRHGNKLGVLGLHSFKAWTTDACNEPFLIQIPNFWAWADKFWGTLGTFSRFISTHFGTVSPNCPCLSLITHYFYKKLILYIQIPNIQLGLGFEFVPQRISP